MYCQSDKQHCKKFCTLIPLKLSCPQKLLDPPYESQYYHHHKTKLLIGIKYNVVPRYGTQTLKALWSLQALKSGVR